MNSRILLLVLVAFVHVNARPAKETEKPVPRYMLRLYQQVTNGLNAGGCGYNTIRNIRNLGEARSCQEYNLRFNASLIPPSDENEFLLAARIHLELNADSTTPAYRNARFRLYLNGATKNTKGRLLSDVTQSTSSKKDVIFNVTAVTLEMQNKPTEFLNFILIVDSEPSLPACPPGAATFEAMLEVESSSSETTCGDDDTENVKLKRSIHNAITKRAVTPYPSSNVCQHLPLAINFREIGWDVWVIEPRNYNAYYCAGSCPFPINDHLNASNHAVVQNFIHAIQPSDVPPACCAPTKLASLMMLYFDLNDVVVLRYMTDMVVDACGCQ